MKFSYKISIKLTENLVMIIKGWVKFRKTSHKLKNRFSKILVIIMKN